MGGAASADEVPRIDEQSRHAPGDGGGDEGVALVDAGFFEFGGGLGDGGLGFREFGGGNLDVELGDGAGLAGAGDAVEAFLGEIAGGGGAINGGLGSLRLLGDRTGFSRNWRGAWGCRHRGP